MGRLIDTVAVRKGHPLIENDFEAIPKADYEARLTELRSMALRVKHNTGSINTLIDKLDDLLSKVKE